MTTQRINLDEPRYDQGTYIGRAKYFILTTNPMNIFTSSKDLEKAKQIVEDHRNGKDFPNLNAEQIWKSKILYDSAYHPDTKEKMMLIGRMSAQVPMNMTITGCMLTFYKTTPAVIFWQWMNQTFNALVNYTNRSGDSPIPVQQLGVSYCLATGGAVGTALVINRLVKSAPAIIGRMVPFCAVAAANCINIPCMRSRELMKGISIFDENGNSLGASTKAAKSAISQVVFSRIMMAVPGMIVPPIIMNILERKAFMKRMPWLNAPIQVGLVGIMLTVATPLCCALFPQKSSISLKNVEPEVRVKLEALPNPPQRVYFNKGL